jgi:hypothetical protein
VRIAAAAVLIASIVAAGGCATDSAPGGADAPPRTLAKVEGWSEDLSSPTAASGLQIAYDEETARLMWSENVPDGLPTKSGDPAAPGIYGSLDDVDFDSQVVAQFSAGESSSCPRWLSDVTTEGQTVEIVTSPDEVGACTADFRPYRQIVALDRDDVPPAEDLGGVQLLIDGAEHPDATVSEYEPKQ